MHFIMYKSLWIHMFAGFLWCSGHLCGGGSGTGVAAGHPPHKLISSMVEIHLHFMVNYYYDIMIIYILFKMVYIIIGRHTYWDAQALHRQLVMYVLKHFIHQCLFIH